MKEQLYPRESVKALLQAVSKELQIMTMTKKGFLILIDAIISDHDNKESPFAIKPNIKFTHDRRNEISESILTYWKYAADKPGQYEGIAINHTLDTIAEWLYYKNYFDLIESQNLKNEGVFKAVAKHILQSENSQLTSSKTKESQTSDHNRSNSDNKLNKLIGTSWWLYCYNEELFGNTTWAGVARFLVEIKSLDDVVIHHLDHFFESIPHVESIPYDCNYTGAVRMHGELRLIFELSHNGGRDLHILLHNVDGIIPAWFTGQFHNVNSTGEKILSGKILFQNATNAEKDEKVLFYIKDYHKFLKESDKTEIADTLKKNIKDFRNLPAIVQSSLFRKSQNFISVKNYYTEAKIKNWNQEEEKAFLNDVQDINYEYEFFISGPASVLGNEFPAFRLKVLDLKDKLEEWYNCKGKVFTLFTIEKLVDFVDKQRRTIPLFEDFVGNLRKSRVFIMLYHDALVRTDSPSLSGMLIEFGFCFHAKTRCLVFWDKAQEKFIPNFIEGASGSPKARVQLERYEQDPLTLEKEEWNRYLRDFCGDQKLYQSNNTPNNP